MRSVELTAHRGYSAIAPENTLAAFEAAVEAGADAVELDVRTSADGVPVVLHDATLGRTTNGGGPVRKKTLAELRTLDAGSWFAPRFAGETIPTLDEALRLLRGRVTRLYVEIKEHASAAGLGRILELIRSHGLEERCVAISFDWAVLARVRGLSSRLALGYLVKRKARFREAVRLAAADGRAQVGCDYRILRRNPSLIAAAREEGVEVAAFTVNDPAVAERLVALGVTRITTDAPGEMRRAL